MILKFKQQYPEYFFVINLLLFFALFYYACEAIIAITAKGGLYSSFIAEHFNVVQWYRQSILQASCYISNLLGYKTEVASSTTILGFNNFSVTVVYSCLGYGVSSFWAAFVVAYPSSSKPKWLWFVVGLVLIWFANVLRIFLLLLKVNEAKDIAQFSQHHLVYNITVYCIVLVMVYFFTKNKVHKNEIR